VRYYETTFIVNPQADDATIDRQVQAVSDLIVSNGGKIIFDDRIGTRRLAYPVAGLTQGYFASLIFESTGAIVPILDRYYRIEEPYLRYLTILFEGDPAAVRERQKEFAARLEEREREDRERYRRERDDDGDGRRYPRRGDRDRDRDRDRGDRPGGSYNRPAAPAAPVAPAAAAAPAPAAPPAAPVPDKQTDDEQL
jgi:small subunit ribosomal protein S6